MSLQYDVNAGLDPSALVSITQAQLLQMIQRIAPLSNIGGIISQAATSAASSLTEGVNGAPDVTNNPRFARYVWLNTFTSPSTRYVYVAPNWVTSTVSVGSINNAEISATAEIAVSKLADGAPNEIIATAADGITVNWTSVASLLSALNDSVPLTSIDDTTAVGAESFLRRVGSTISWKTFIETVTTIQAALSGVSPAIFTPGSNNTLLGTNGSGVVAFNTPANILANNSITLALLAGGGGALNDILKFDGSNWIKVTPTLRLVAGDASNSGLITPTTGTGLLSGVAHAFNHGLVTVPKLWTVVAVKNATAAPEAGYNENDEVEIHGVFARVGNLIAVTTSADATAVYISFNDNDLEVSHKTTGVQTVITEANWFLKVYAWK